MKPLVVVAVFAECELILDVVVERKILRDKWFIFSDLVSCREIIPQQNVGFKTLFS
tara:strand:+ start:97 stop:264 length:168 start_codon:yes stop_codon:yes gene_type:complete